MIKQLLTYLLLASITVINAQKKYTPKMYIEQFSQPAMEEMKVSKIPASITLAQGLLESGNGNSRLARKGNNHFGIKCKKSWTGKTIRENDDAPDECFRAYSSAYESYRDHSNFLRNNRRYRPLFQLDIMDYKGWANGLRKAGYATNPAYSKLLIRMIERYHLNHFDSMVYFKMSEIVTTKVENVIEKNEVDLLLKGKIVDNGVPATLAFEGESIKSIAHNHDKMTWQIRRYNDLPRGTIIKPGDIVYLKPKRRKASIPFHRVEPGQSMWDVSQVYGMKLRRLYRINKMKRGTNASPGVTLHLRKRAKQRPDTSSTHVINKDVERKAITIKNSNGSIKHFVQKGETLYWLTKFYKTSAIKLQKLNPNKLPPKAGDTLVIEEAILMESVEIKQEKLIDPLFNKIKPTNTPYLYSQDSALLYYVVKSKETLYYISGVTGVSLDSLVYLNGKKILQGLNVGQHILIRQLKELEFESYEDIPSNENTNNYHIVVEGETLYSISKKYSISVETLKLLNPKLEETDISIGQKLLLL